MIIIITIGHKRVIIYTIYKTVHIM